WAQINITGWALGPRIIYVHGKDKKGNWGPLTNKTIEITEACRMHIEHMVMKPPEKIKGCKYIYVKVTILDEKSKPVKDAYVTGKWTVPNSFDYLNGTWTDSDGCATLWARTKKQGTFTFKFEVTNVTKTDCIYDSNANKINPPIVSQTLSY
ncbi:MAG: hypothetical protein QXX08_02950, partial [Candidatus Bathyarchaeia archaeon]